MSLLYRFLSILFVFFFVSPAQARPLFDVLYFKSADLEQILDYRENLEAVLEAKITRKIKIMGGAKAEYALVYDCNVSKSAMEKIVARQSALLQRGQLAAPYGIKNSLFAPVYNISYGIGPNLEPLKKRYTHLYSLLDEEAAGNLVIEKTDSGNYVLVLHFRGRKKEATAVARVHKKMLRSKKFTASLAPENGNDVVYGESSHIDNVQDSLAAHEETKEERKDRFAQQRGSGKIKIIKAKKYTKYPQRQEQQVLHVAKGKESSLEQEIEREINRLRRKRRIRSDETTGWMVYDLEQNRSIVDINANRSFQAASMIKPFVALAFFHKVQQGKLKYGPTSRRKMELMIQRSNNAATNWIMKRVGGPSACNRLLHANYPGIFRNMRICEYIPRGGRTYRNSASPADYVRFLKAMWENSLPRSRELRRLMALPGRDRIYRGTPIPRGTLVYNKTGSTAHLVGDMGILVAKARNGRRYPYIVVGVIQRSSRPASYGRWLNARGNVIRKISTLVYKRMKKIHRLR